MTSTGAQTTAVGVLAVNNFGDTRSGGLAGPMALLIILLLAVATVLLIRNMNARLRRLPDRFPGQDGPTEDGQDGPERNGGGPGGGERTAGGSGYVGSPNQSPDP